MLSLEELVPELTNAERSDYYCYLRNRGLGVEDHSAITLKGWKNSLRRGSFAALVDKKRRKDFSPGRYWAPSPTGVYLNGNFVRGSGAYRLKHGE